MYSNKKQKNQSVYFLFSLTVCEKTTVKNAIFIFLYIQWFNPNKIYHIKVQVKLYDMCKFQFDLYSLSSKIRFKKICHNFWGTLYERRSSCFHWKSRNFPRYVSHCKLLHTDNASRWSNMLMVISYSQYKTRTMSRYLKLIRISQ